jgi:hypothetical protein
MNCPKCTKDCHEDAKALRETIESLKKAAEGKEEMKKWFQEKIRALLIAGDEMVDESKDCYISATWYKARAGL